MSITIVRTLSEEEWRRFVEQHPAGNIFHTPEMFQVFAAAKGHHPELWAATTNGRLLALMLPVRITLEDGLLRSFTTRAIVYGDVICVPGIEGQGALRMLVDDYVRETKGDLLYTELRHRTNDGEIRTVLEDCGFGFEEEDNYLVDLALPVEQVWQNISKSARRHIRHAQKEAGLTIEELHDRDKLAVWHSLIQETFSRVHVPLADYSLFEAAFDILYPKGMVQLLLGQVKDQYIAASVALLYKRTIYGWYRGFIREFRDYLPNDLMVWYCLKQGAEKGYRVFDFGGAGRPDQDYGPRRFKAKFGGALVSHGRHVYVHAPVRLRLSRVAYGLMRKILWRTSKEKDIQ